MSEADLLQPGNIVRERWKVVSESIFLIEKKAQINLENELCKKDVFY